MYRVLSIDKSAGLNKSERINFGNLSYFVFCFSLQPKVKDLPAIE
jgi:hypothetical protein